MICQIYQTFSLPNFPAIWYDLKFLENAELSHRLLSSKMSLPLTDILALQHVQPLLTHCTMSGKTMKYTSPSIMIQYSSVALM